MSRVPAGLSYLTIYNPTLRLTQPSDDEDAEEQAHILFYTARERAVSRDRMLRQVGLAKALVSFSQMFNAEDPCDTVHSQSKRMIMVSPEPNYWIHACIDLAKTPRPATVRGKGKGKDKPSTSKPDAISYDYHDASVHDIAIREHILRGYEHFKLLHGPFESILATLGHEALELQLERFWTVWAWRWDIEQDCQFAALLGEPLHPLSRVATPLLDRYSSAISDDLCVFALKPPYVIPSSKFSTSRYPRLLPHYVMSRIPPPTVPAEADADASKVATSTSGAAAGQEDGKSSEASRATSPSSFLAMPSMNLSMDMRGLKWNWPGYLTFGKVPRTSSLPTSPSGTPAKLPPSDTDQHTTTDDSVDAKQHAIEGLKPDPVGVDTESLLEAISSQNVHTPSTREGSPASAHVPQSQIEEIASFETEEIPEFVQDENTTLSVDLSDTASNVSDDHVVEGSTRPSTPMDPQRAASTETILQEALPPFLSTRVHLSDATDAFQTQRKRVWHLTKDAITVVMIVNDDDTAEPPCTAEQAVTLISAIHGAFVEAEMKEGADAIIPTATKILQPQDRHIIRTGEYTLSPEPGFSSNSEHLFYEKEMLTSDADVLEVFSRGQNPQHWHVAKRGLGTDSDGHSVEGEIYLEVARKESTLTDVDNALATVLRKYIDTS
ncbi:hypothetical protein OBBRIDRAFT_796262 [Obba rivulosa]|uniref:CCZ1/INTU/HSP4 first Longin domain-containing protein n=1 Tax=Obba rivulosa TaxID=1052685 RepID=A0A8E2AVD9_9APHY|nr:hypothetical protein OBBRIDRAFT_796262 [Obba rivulosa]